MLHNDNLKSPKTQGTNFSMVPDDGKIATRWISSFPQTIYYKGEYYRPDENGDYFPIPLDSIKREILQFLKMAEVEGYRVTASRLYSVVELARIEIAITSKDFILTGGAK